MARGKLKNTNKQDRRRKGSMNLLRGEGKYPGVCLGSIYECKRSKTHSFSGGLVQVDGINSKGRIMLAVIKHPNAKDKPRKNFTARYSYFIKNYIHKMKVCRGTRCTCNGRAIPVENFYKGNKKFFWDGYQATCIKDKNLSLHNEESKRKRLESYTKKTGSVPLTLPMGKNAARQYTLPVYEDVPISAEKFLNDLRALAGLVKSLETQAQYFIKLEKQHKKNGNINRQKLFEDLRKVIQASV